MNLKTLRMRIILTSLRTLPKRASMFVLTKSPIIIPTKYGKIAKRSTRFNGLMKNTSFLGEHINLTKYSMMKNQLKM